MPKSRGKANQNRHENGLAAPGKRIGKQQSNGNLRPPPNGNSTPPSSPLHSSPAVTHLAASSQSVDAPNGTAAAATMGSATKIPDVDGLAPSPDFPILTGPEAHAFEAGLLGDVNGHAHGHARTDDLGGTVSISSMADSLTLAATILKSCPLRDVIAILIILLQLPPTFLTIINALYTLLTFVPPTSGVLPSLHEIYIGGTGAPSLIAIIAMDIFILGIWMLFWERAQNYILDLSQAVIAVSLGGVAAGKNGTTNAFLICAAIVLASHANRHNTVRYYGHHILWGALSKVSSGRIQGPLRPDTIQEIVWAPRSWINRGFALHIFSQGVLRWLRRFLLKHQSQSSSSSTDPEAGLSQSPRSNSISVDSSPDTCSSTSSDGRPPGQPPASGLGKERDPNAKRKRKQANLVRRLQPFWAALASTKVTVMKEMEQAQPSQDAIEADATDVNHIGSVNPRETKRVWITELLPNEIRFQGAVVNHSSHVADGSRVGGDGGAGVDKAKPFYVRLNGADWASTRFHLSHSFVDSSGETVDSWAGEIYGLTPHSSYYCEFIRSSDETLISAVQITSPRAPTAEQVSAPTTAHQSFRPSSPSTTLKNSIVAAESNLTELRNKLKKIRKEHKSAITSLRKEVDSLVVRSESAGNSDDRQRQRILQMKQNIQTANNASAEMSEQADFLATLPDEDLKDYDAKKAQWKESLTKHKNAQECLNEANRKATQDQSQLKSDIHSITQKRERLKTRLDKLNEQYDKLTTSAATTSPGHASLKAHRDALRAQAIIQREMKEGQIVSQIESMDRERDAVLQKLAAVTQQIQLLQSNTSHSSSYHTHAALPSTHSHPSAPPTPEGILPNSLRPSSFLSSQPPPPPSASSSLSFPSFGTQLSSHAGAAALVKSSTPGSGYREARDVTTRGRSSSMLSDVSGLTDHQDALSVEGGEGNAGEMMSPSAIGAQTLQGQQHAGVVGMSPPLRVFGLSSPQSL